MNNIIQLSDHFSLAEATASSKAEEVGVDNTQCSPEVITNAVRTAVKMEKVRLLLHNSISVKSWIRCLLLNRALGSKDTSQHILGLAVDFTCPKFGTPLEICKLLLANKDLIGFDQLILEHTWVHISFALPNVQPRNQVLSLLATGGYAAGLTNNMGISYV